MQKNKSYEQGHNKFSDTSFSEIKMLRMSLEVPLQSRIAPNTVQLVSSDISNTTSISVTPSYVNYTEFMQPIKDQKGKNV